MESIQAGRPVYLVFHREDLKRRLGELIHTVACGSADFVRIQAELVEASGSQLMLGRCAE